MLSAERQSVRMSKIKPTMRITERRYGVGLHSQSLTANDKQYKKAVLPQGNRAMPQVFFSVEVRQQHSLQV